MVWTIDSVCVNSTDYNLHPKSPNSTAVWWGSVENTPDTIHRNSTGKAGRFRATAGTATGATGMSVYTSPDPNRIIIFLVMMPYGAGEVNETRVAFLDNTSTIDLEQVKRIWNDKQFGTSASYSFNDNNGKQVKLYLSSKIDQGTNVEAKFTLEYDN